MQVLSRQRVPERGDIANIVDRKIGGVDRTGMAVERHGIEIPVIAPQGMRGTGAALARVRCYNPIQLQMNDDVLVVNRTTARVTRLRLGGDR